MGQVMSGKLYNDDRGVGCEKVDDRMREWRLHWQNTLTATTSRSGGEGYRVEEEWLIANHRL